MTCPAGRSRFNQKIWGHFRLGRVKFLLGAWTMAVSLATAAGQSGLNSTCPLAFFTNVATRLLSAQTEIDLTHIQISPTNQYTPAVHRLLQVAANVYEATTTNSYPTVFRPIFLNDGTNVFIAGYEQVVSVADTSDPQLTLPVDVADMPIGFSTNLNVYGVPWIIGAKKGFPSFNEFSMQSVVQVVRKLELTRPSLNALPPDVQTNQMYIFSISNVCGVECWNSYTGDYTTLQSNGVQILAQDSLSMTFTNDNGMPPVLLSLLAANFTNLPAQWPGTSQPWFENPMPNLPVPNSFVIPLFTNVVLFTNLAYAYGYHQFENTTNFLDFGIQPLPQFGLLTTNRLRVVMLDGNHVIDYVQFAGPDSSFNLNAALADVDLTGLKGLWDTNLSGTVPYGVANQILYADNPLQNRAITLTPNDNGTFPNPPGGGTAGQAIAFFDSFINQVVNGTMRGVGVDPNTHFRYTATNLSLITQVPFTPTRTIFNYISWQANDPLVHDLASDLNYSGTDYGVIKTGTNQWNNISPSVPILPDLGQLNRRYQPWGINLPIAGTDSNPYNLAIKDSLVGSSDDWDFPTNQPMSGVWLGRVHRGTPWQTIYLKAPDVLREVQVAGGTNIYIGTNTWLHWTGNFDVADAVAMAPVQDWHVASLLVHMMSSQPLQSLFSVNNPKPNAWFRALNGLTASTNDLSDSQLGLVATARFDKLIIRPHSPQTEIIANAIESARANQPGGFFQDVGDILEVPQLSYQSPFLNWNDSAQQVFGISDEAYEIVPSQLLPLLRADSIGKLAPKNGQVIAQFSGYDNHSYAIQVSSNLTDWTSVATNSTMNGGFSFTNSVPSNSGTRFYRSLLVQ